jgi:23S rRNA G2445 N2-methylase RlmL
MSDKKQTAVEWMVQRIIDRQNGVINEFPIFSLDQIFDHAKEMEKQQIIDSLHYFGIENAEEYYTETYGRQTYEQ